MTHAVRERVCVGWSSQATSRFFLSVSLSLPAGKKVMQVGDIIMYETDEPSTQVPSARPFTLAPL